MSRLRGFVIGVAALGGLGVLALALWPTAERAPIADLRFQTPRATLFTFLDCYGVADLPQTEIIRRMQIGRTFHLNDPATRDLALRDYRGPEDEGLVGYVFGSLAPVKDDLRIADDGQTAHTIASDDAGITRPVVLERTDAGWRIVLRRSVPESVQERLRNAGAEAPTQEVDVPDLPDLPDLP